MKKDLSLPNTLTNPNLFPILFLLLCCFTYSTFFNACANGILRIFLDWIKYTTR